MTKAYLEQWHLLAQQLRVDSIRATSEAGSGHPSSSMSAADLVAVLMYKYLHYDFYQLQDSLQNCYKPPKLTQMQLLVQLN